MLLCRGSTRQSLCRVQSRHLVKKSGRHGAGCVNTCFAECHVRGARQRFFNFFSKILCRVRRHSAKIFLFFLIISLPSALLGRRSANIFYFFFVISLPSALSGRHSATIFFKKKIFAECPGLDTPQSWEFCKCRIPSFA